MMAVYFGFILLVAWAKPLLGHPARARAEPRHPARGARDRLRLGAHLDLRALGEQPLRRDRAPRCGSRADEQRPRRDPTSSAIFFFFLFVAVTLAITFWAARRTRSTEHFYAAGRSVTGLQNGLALAGDYMSAASFLGHRRARGRRLGLRRPHLLDRLPGRLAGGDVPDRRAAAQPGPLHLRGRGRLPAAADPGADRGRHRHARGRDLLPDRPDGRRRQPDQAAVRHPLRDGRS